MKLSIIIVNYNVKYFVEQCLNSIYQNLSDGGILNKQNTEVFVVDNDSKDHSIKYLQKR
ncbi:MAG: glycosyltransferase, partial [Bacteroidaceae bacterium]|nr:glycosyltransferase [Bacteroidaceae bacterium]